MALNRSGYVCDRVIQVFLFSFSDRGISFFFKETTEISYDYDMKRMAVDVYSLDINSGNSTQTRVVYEYKMVSFALLNTISIHRVS